MKEYKEGSSSANKEKVKKAWKDFQRVLHEMLKTSEGKAGIAIIEEISASIKGHDGYVCAIKMMYRDV
jgi:hypothetical protein